MILEPDFFQLIQLANFKRPGRAECLAYRSRAAAMLAYCAGLRFTEIEGMEGKHWMTDDDAAIVVPGNEQRSARRVPVSPAVRWAVESFIAKRGSSTEVHMFSCEGGLRLKQEITNALRTTGLLSDRLKAGALRAAFESAILNSARGDTRAYYLVGMQPPPELPDLHDHPPVDELDRILRRSGHLYQDDHRLWRP